MVPQVSSALPTVGVHGTRPSPSSPWAVRRSLPWAGVLVLWLAGCVMLWGFSAIPFQDLPAHAGLIALRARLPGSSFEQPFLVLAPHLGPYSVFRLLGAVFAEWLGPLNAVRAIATAVWLAYPVVMATARFRLTGQWSATHALLGMLLCSGLMTMLGFASFQLGAAVLILALVEWQLLLEATRPSAPRYAAVALLLAVLFLAHGHAFLLFVLLAPIPLLQTPRRFWRAGVLLPAFLVAAYSAGIETFGLPAAVVASGESFAPRFQSPLEKLALLGTPTLMTRLGPDLAMSLGLWALAAWVTVRGRHSTEPRFRSLRWQALALFGLFALLPHSVGWFGFVDARLLPSALALCFLGVDYPTLGPRVGRGLRLFAATAPAVVLGCALYASARFQDEARGFDTVAAAIPSSTRVLHLPVDPDSRIFAAHPFLHYDKLALTERPLLLSDTWFHQGSALYPTAAHPARRLPKTYAFSVLERVQWSGYQWDDWDYVLVRQRPESPAPAVPVELQSVVHENGWWLFRVQRPRAER